MRERFSQMFRLRSGEANLVLVLGFALFINDVTMGISKVVSVSGFLSEYRDYYILPVWAVDMALLILATGLQSLIIDRFHRLKLFGSIVAGLVILYGLLAITFSINNFPLQVSYTLLYLLTDQQWLIFPLIFWILVNDIFDPAQARRLFPLIGTFAFVGTVAGLLVAQLDAAMGFGAVKLLIFNSIVSLLVLIVVFTGLRKTSIRHNPQETISISEALSGGWMFIREVPAFRYLSISMIAAGITITILLYDTLSDASLQFGDHFQSFYALYSLVIAVVSIMVQFVSGKIIEKFGLKDSFVILPFSMLLGTVVNFFVPGFISSATAQGLSRVMVQTVDQSSRKSFQAMVPAEKRGRVSLFIDSYLPSLGTILGSLITYSVILWGIAGGITRQIFTSYYLVLAIIAALVAVVSSLLMRSVYDQSMFNWQLKRRSRGSSVMDKLDFSDSDKK